MDWINSLWGGGGSAPRTPSPGGRSSGGNSGPIPPSPTAMRRSDGGGGVATRVQAPAMDPTVRATLFGEVISPGSRVDLEVMRALAFQGIPDRGGLRAKYWRVLLHVLPPDTREWAAASQRLRQSYRDFCDALILDPAKFSSTATSNEADALGTPVEIDESGEHPLSTGQHSQWNAYFADNELLKEIDKDVRRTAPDLNFFNQNRVNDTLPRDHVAAIRRILFVYAKLNPGVKYVQGMNEILAPLYYVNATDPDDNWAEHAEADSFFCFTNLMAEIRDVFVKTLDSTDHGVKSTMARLMMLVQRHDSALYDALQANSVDVQFFAFRWLTLLLGQEFDLPDLLRIWDAFFADSRRFDFLLYFCAAMMILVREDLLVADFAESLKLLQNFPHNTYDVGCIFNLAVRIRDEDSNLNWRPSELN